MRLVSDHLLTICYAQAGKCGIILLFLGLFSLGGQLVSVQTLCAISTGDKAASKHLFYSSHRYDLQNRVKLNSQGSFSYDSGLLNVCISK